MTYQDLLLEKDADTKVAVITMNRSEKMNALSRELRAELVAALQECDADPDVHAVVLTGAGRGFSAGADLGGGGDSSKAVRGLSAIWQRDARTGIAFTRQFRDMTKPVIAAVNGWCLGWGLELATICDFVIASDRAQFGAPEIRHGSIVDTILPWNVGPQWARYMMMSGATINAQKAVDIGLALKVVPHDQLMVETLKFAHTLAKIPPMAMQLNKRMIDGIMNIAGVSAGLEFGGAISTICHELDEGVTTPDGRNLKEIRQQHGLKAFLEARDAPHREMDAEQRVYDRD